MQLEVSATGLGTTMYTLVKIISTLPIAFVSPKAFAKKKKA